jgi:hypothetical protein
MAYSTWNKWPSGEKTVIARSYDILCRQIQYSNYWWLWYDVSSDLIEWDHRIQVYEHIEIFIFDSSRIY